MSAHILPDSRAGNETFGSQMVDWPLPDGTAMRLEAVAVYCANCGKHSAWAPGTGSGQNFLFYLCAKCYEKHGDIVGTFALPDDEFCQNVAAEMLDKHGKHLSEVEIATLDDAGRLAKELKLLERESPYLTQTPR